jgi:hypothetical protein
MKFNSTQAVTMRGDSVHSDTIDIVEGWNIIGGISSPVAVTSIIEEPSNVLLSDFFGYNHGYENASVIEPGKGYWVKANSNGKIIVSDALTFNRSEVKQNKTDKFNRLTITDSKGKKQYLYFGIDNQLFSKQSYELPPLPPTGVFDARFTSQHFVACVDENESATFPINISSASTPITMSWEIIQANSHWSLKTNKNSVLLSGSGSITISEQESANVILQNEKSVGSLPTRTRLLPNYPNPFNPQTTIRFELEEALFVSLKIFDALGRQIAILLENQMNRGYHEVLWNASNYPSGIYTVQLQTNNLSFQTRILLLK